VFTVFPGVLVALLIVMMSYSLDDKRLSHMAQESGR
jgi:Na+/melibiose symporter-like transporter